MVSDSSTGSNLDPPKSKRERIRDNQRRSRARKQDYLEDMEQRLKKCQVAFREAELQRAVFADLQVENAHLRDLLNHIGISADVVENSSLRNVSQQGIDVVAAVHRQIEPKYQPPTLYQLATPTNVLAQTSTSKSHCPTMVVTSPHCLSAAGLTNDSLWIDWPQNGAAFMARPSADLVNLSSMNGIPPHPMYGGTQVELSNDYQNLAPTQYKEMEIMQPERDEWHPQIPLTSQWFYEARAKKGYEYSRHQVGSTSTVL